VPDWSEEDGQPPTTAEARSPMGKGMAFTEVSPWLSLRIRERVIRPRFELGGKEGLR